MGQVSDAERDSESDRRQENSRQIKDDDRHWQTLQGFLTRKSGLQKF